MREVWQGEESNPTKLAAEIASTPSQIFQPHPNLESLEIVHMSMSVANRDLVVKALRAYGQPN